ncbi:MAG: hypothetical protein WCD37_03850 [Chloroflexia bacterium]
MPNLTWHYHVLLPDAAFRRLLVLRDGDHWTLPGFVMHKRRYWQEVDHVNAAMRDLLGAQVSTLSCLYTRSDPQDGEANLGHVHRLYALENHDPRWSPPVGARWIDRADLDGLALRQPQHRPWIEQWFDEAEGAPLSPLRKDWMRPGWHKQAVEWATEQLDKLGIAHEGDFVQLRAWERSYLARVPTREGYIYFKALPPMFGHEIPLLLMFDGRFPGNFPALPAADLERRFMLMRDFGGARLDTVDNLERWKEALGTLASIQASLSRNVEELLILGCPDRRLDRVSASMRPFLAGAESHLSMGHTPFTEDELARLRALIPRLEDGLAMLGEYGIPPSLDHGDMWPQNIIDRGDGFLYFDWSDSTVSHPFFSVFYLFGHTDVRLPGGPDAYARLRDAYLEPWHVYASMERLRAAFDLSMQLAPLHLVLNYHLTILPGLERKWEMENMVPFFLRMLLKE